MVQNILQTAVYKSHPKFPNDHSALFLMAKFPPSLTAYTHSPISIFKEIVQNAFQTSYIYHLPYMSHAKSISSYPATGSATGCLSQYTTE